MPRARRTANSRRKPSAPLGDPSAHLVPRHKLWLVLSDTFLMGPNYLRFLVAVDETGTIREAGKAVRWSYRTCLNRIRRMEATLGQRVLDTSRGGASGGGARLTPEARRLVEIFSHWQREMEHLSRESFEAATHR